MASKDALAIRREAAFARIAQAAGVEPPAANRDPDVTLTQFVEWAADQIAGPAHDEAEAETVEAETETVEAETVPESKPVARKPRKAS